jgi:hypothetical protein
LVQDRFGEIYGFLSFLINCQVGNDQVSFLELKKNPLKIKLT